MLTNFYCSSAQELIQKVYKKISETNKNNSKNSGLFDESRNKRRKNLTIPELNSLYILFISMIILYYVLILIFIFKSCLYQHAAHQFAIIGYQICLKQYRRITQQSQFILHVLPLIIASYLISLAYCLNKYCIIIYCLYLNFDKIDMNRFVLNRGMFNFAISKFKDHITEQVLADVSPQLHPPQVISTEDREKYRHENKIKFKRNPKQLKDDWTRDLHNRIFTQKEAMTEASRCMKCADSPCQKACSTGIDIRSFIYQIQNQNYYGAAKTILSDNPLGLSCGGLCPVSQLCASTCNAYWLQGGTIQIGKLQQFACKIFKQMKVKQIRDPNLKPLDSKVVNTKIALIGAGSASLSCAAFLGRLGYNNVHIYEKSQYPGGLVTSEIPANRSNYEDVLWQIQMVQQLGVKIFYNKTFGKDLTEQSLKKDGYQTIFIGSGLTSPKSELGKDAYLLPNVFSSKTFLPNVCENVKLSKSKQKIYKLNGHVIVLGIGDTALDCARSALRVGADRVSVVFRRGFNDARANQQIMDPATYQKINFISNLTPSSVLKDNNIAVGMQFDQYFVNSSGKYELTGEKIKIKSDFIISAFGSKNEQSEIQSLIKDSNNKINISRHTMQNKDSKKAHIFSGGDIIGTQNLVDAVNDGKVASWYIHKYIGNKHGIDYGDKPILPRFFTEIDLVDISTEMSGIKFDNPFGLASAPPATSYPMIRRAFQLGWGFSLTKTFVLDKDQIVNVAPRIFKATNDPLRKQPSFSNIQLISEKKARYWVEGALQLKKDFPNKIIIGSIMASFEQADWQQLAKMSEIAKFDILELNLSCNHGMPDKGMGRACSDVPEVVEDIVKWVKKYYTGPVFVKLSPNSTITQKITEATLNAGGHGVSATNTMYSFMDPQHNMQPYPAVGENKQTFFGGACGSILRPIALRVATNIANDPSLDKAQLMATGGIINAQHAMSYAKFGRCSVFQIASAVQQQDFGIIQDLNSGLKTLLYLMKRDDLIKKGWKGQSPPVHQMQQLKKFRNNFNFWEKGQQPTKVNINQVPTLKDIRGKGAKHFQHITHMSKQQKFPVITDDLCVNCGKCYMTCLDSGYQAITFNSKTHKPEITADCTGCGLCFAVCPIPGALQYGPRPESYEYKPNRGTQYFV